MQSCSSVIFHCDCVCDLCGNRNESTERFPLFFDTSVCGRCLRRYHTHAHRMKCTEIYAQITFPHLFFYIVNFSVKPSTDFAQSFCLSNSCGWRKSWQCIVRSLSSSVWGAGGLTHWDPRPAHCDRQPAWRPGQSSKTHTCTSIISMLAFFRMDLLPRCYVYFDMACPGNLNWAKKQSCAKCILF